MAVPFALATTVREGPIDTWNGAELLVGLGGGTLATVVAVALSRGRERPVPLAGVALALAGLWSVGYAAPPGLTLVIGIVGVGGAALLRSRSPWLCFTAVLPFAAIVGFNADLALPTVLQCLATTVVALGAVLAPSFDEAWQVDAPGPGLCAVSAIGLWLAVPDTEPAAALVGVTLPLAVLGWPTRLARLGTAGAAASVAVFVWAVAVGSAGRGTAFVGGVACLGALLGAPVGRAVVEIMTRSLAGLGVLRGVGPLLTAQVAVVLVAARVGAVMERGAAAALGVAIAAAISVATGVVVMPRRVGSSQHP